MFPSLPEQEERKESQQHRQDAHHHPIGPPGQQVAGFRRQQHNQHFRADQQQVKAAQEGDSGRPALRHCFRQRRRPNRQPEQPRVRVEQVGQNSALSPFDPLTVTNEGKRNLPPCGGMEDLANDRMPGVNPGGRIAGKVKLKTWRSYFLTQS
jgi:hypothetical protein